MENTTASGVLCLRTYPYQAFLLLRHKDRWDIPKGYREQDEDEITCALRELSEETGILSDQVEIDPHFRFVTQYRVKPLYLQNQLIDKTYVVFLGYLKKEQQITLSEHVDFCWFAWNPPHLIQEWLIDPLLQAVSEYFIATK